MLKYAKANKNKIAFILVYAIDRLVRSGDYAFRLLGRLDRMRYECAIDLITVVAPRHDLSRSNFPSSLLAMFTKFDTELKGAKIRAGKLKSKEAKSIKN